MKRQEMPVAALQNGTVIDHIPLKQVIPGCESAPS